MKTKIVFTPAYEEALSHIENFIFNGLERVSALDVFWHDHDQALEFISQNPETPASHPTTGDQSWPFGDGRYRVFFKYIKSSRSVYMTHIIDNRQLNLEIYPGNSMPTYDEE